MKVVIFFGRVDQVQDRINDWLQNNSNIEIINTTQSNSQLDNVITISIFYKKIK